MIMNLWSTPVGVYDIKPFFDDFEATNARMIEAFPRRSVESNRFSFDGNEPFRELSNVVRTHLGMYSSKSGLGEDLTFFDGFFNSHTPGQVNAPHAHPVGIVVAIYYARALGKGHGDLLIQDPRGGVLWTNVLDEDSRGVGGYRIFKRITPETGQLIVFPAYVIHSVEPNLLPDQPTRMSIGINCFSKNLLRYLNPDVG